MRSLVLIFSVLITVPAVGCFRPAYHADPARRFPLAELPLLDAEELDLDAQVIEQLNDERNKPAAVRSLSKSETNLAVGEKLSGQIATDPAAQSSNQLPAKTLAQKQLEQTDRIIDLMEKIDDDDVRRILAEKIATNDPPGKADAAKSPSSKSSAVQFASYTEDSMGFDADLGSVAVNSISESQPRQLDESGLPIEPPLAATESTTVASIKPIAADAGSDGDRAQAETKPGSWKQELHSAISELEKSLYQNDLENDDQATLQIYLRLLHLIANNKEQATRGIPELDKQDQQFWQSLMAALATLLDSGSAIADSATFQNSQRTATDRTLEHLRQAINQLSPDANLQIENVALCREVNGYGQFEPFKTNEFLPKQQVLIYCELENFVSVTVSSGNDTKYETEFKGSFTILNEQQQAVYQHEYSAVRDIGQRRRRDFYMYFPMTIPQLPSGSYFLQLEIEDLKGNKAGTLEKPLPFIIR